MTLKTTYFSTLSKLCIGAVFVGLTACSTATPTHGNVFEENKYQIAESIERLELYPQINGLQLNPRDQEAVSRFIRDFSENGDGQIFMNIPSNQAGGIGAQQAEALIQTALRQSGYSAANVQTGRYQVPKSAPAPVVVSYRKFATLIPRCNTKQDLRLTGNNQAYLGFGCAHFANQAALIGDHRQLLAPAELTPPDATRRSAVYNSYIEGADPSSANGSRQGATFGGN